MFKMKDLGLNIQGSYRKIISKPSNLYWKCMNHVDNVSSGTEVNELLLEFDLPPSSYATILIRVDAY